MTESGWTNEDGLARKSRHDKDANEATANKQGLELKWLGIAEILDKKLTLESCYLDSVESAERERSRVVEAFYH